jgi:hypothetical protein
MRRYISQLQLIKKIFKLLYMKANKKQKTTIFIHDVKPFNSQMLVCVGSTGIQIDAWLRKNAIKSAKNLLNKENIKWIEENTHLKGFVLRKKDEEGLSTYVLWLKQWINKWEPINTLLHELIHYKQAQWKDRFISEDEEEFEAYFLENLFDDLRRELNKRLKA